MGLELWKGQVSYVWDGVGYFLFQWGKGRSNFVEYSQLHSRPRMVPNKRSVLSGQYGLMGCDMGNLLDSKWPSRDCGFKGLCLPALCRFLWSTLLSVTLISLTLKVVCKMGILWLCWGPVFLMLEGNSVKQGRLASVSPTPLLLDCDFLQSRKGRRGYQGLNCAP